MSIFAHKRCSDGGTTGFFKTNSYCPCKGNIHMQAVLKSHHLLSRFYCMSFQGASMNV